MSDLAVYAALFALAFAAATILPAQSEAALVGLLLTGEYPPLILLAAASLGNIAGAAANWLLGRFIAQYRERSWFPVKRETVKRAEAWYRRYGKWSLLLSWMPVIGDPLTLAAGILREPFPTFLLLVALAKTGRYGALAVLTLGWT